jgi:antitoxin component of RelBE/YafQ-DinJ toxin-antitoxin module
MNEWMTPTEIAASRIPGLPVTKRDVNRLAKLKNWRRRVSSTGYETLARKREGREGGGGWEYHLSIVTEGLDPLRLIVTEQNLETVEQVERIRKIDSKALHVSITAEDMAALNRAAHQKAIPVELVLSHCLQQALAILRIAE